MKKLIDYLNEVIKLDHIRKVLEVLTVSVGVFVILAIGYQALRVFGYILKATN